MTELMPSPISVFPNLQGFSGCGTLPEELHS